jgi:hypothetical protein
VSTPASNPGTSEEKQLAAPTRALANPPPPPISEQFSTFHRFPDLPAEIRVKIWALINPPPQILHINYDVYEKDDRSRWNHRRGKREWRGKWIITSPKIKLVNLSICQESRDECLRVYSPVRLLRHNTQQAFFNFKTDTMFLNTNATKSDKENKVLPPEGLPFASNVGEQIRHLAISMHLWFTWPFLKEYGSCMCNRCRSRDITHWKFVHSFKDSMKRLEKVQILRHEYVSVGWSKRFIRALLPGRLRECDRRRRLPKKFWFVRREWPGGKKNKAMIFAQNHFKDGVEVELVELETGGLLGPLKRGIWERRNTNML